ncbi:MAG: hypothetical protein QOK05_3096 [Chloroflexota bacterium]|jgi:hypothetical protein|nr:hypothetical protein [Chloroflexota bacterium]
MVEDSWSRWEFPALQAIAEEFDTHPHGTIITTTDVVARLDPKGTDEDRWGRAIDRLAKTGYVEAIQTMWGKPYPINVVEVTERGLRATGAWPAPERILKDLAAMLAAEADRLEPGQPVRAGKIRAAGAALGKVAADVGSELVLKFAARAAGL